MLNYSNLNDVEFEYLCQDIMSKRLGIDLRRFAAGKDGGIDLADSTCKPKIIVQVKHYIKTDVNGLIQSLAKECVNVEELKPTHYYVCCSKELSAKRISEIYSMFSNYMDSDKNILTLNEIEDFLIDNENISVLRKHYKLWISSTNILQDLHNTDIFIDCESLLATIQRDEKYFVQTSAYTQALRCLSKHKTLFLVGEPGVGKTITSKMIILNYAAKGHRIRYTTDVTDLASLKRALAQDRNAKEVILLDDCFGQAYFEMKSSQGTELLSLIRFVNSSKNKLLILNSRIVIYQEARIKTPELVNSFENKEYGVQILNMSAMSELEKAKILYNHMYFSTENEEYFKAIKIDKNYMNIINHKNYNPRIIEFVANPNRYKGIPANEYYKFVAQCLDNPHMVWDNEYEERIQVVDRCLLMTLFSLSNTTVSYELVKKCFLKRVQHMSGIDTTVNQFERSLARLQESFIGIVDDNGCKKLSMVNPSINDYLKSKLEGNSLERENILEAAAAIQQYRRLLPVDKADDRIASLLETGKIKEILFESESEKNGYISSFIALNSIKNLSYTDNVYSYLENIGDVYDYNKSIIPAANILIKLFEEKMFNFYRLDTYLRDFELFKKILVKFELEELPRILSECYQYFEIEDGFIDMCEEVVNDRVSKYCESVDASSFDIDVGKLLNENTRIIQYAYDEYGSEPDRDAIIETVENKINDIMEQEIELILNSLPGDLSGGWFVNTPYEISIEGVDDLVDSYLQSDYDDDDDFHGYGPNSSIDIDLLFNR
jgi:DNA replication protein DnaC